MSAGDIMQGRRDQRANRERRYLCGVLGDVANERDLQEARKAAGRFVATCADPGAMTNAERLAVLVEEVGEVAQEVLTQDGRRLARDTVGTVEALRGELVQVAAVAVAWIEGLDAEAAPDAWLAGQGIDPDTGESA